MELAAPVWLTVESLMPREPAMRLMSFTERGARDSAVRVGSAAQTLSMSSALPSEMPYCSASAALSLVAVTVWVSTEASKPPSPTALLMRALTCCCRLSAFALSPFSTETRMELRMSSR